MPRRRWTIHLGRSVRGRNFSDMLAKVPPTVLAHDNVIRQLDYQHESDSRYLLRHRDDPDKELMLTVLCFNVPRDSNQ